MMMQNLFYIYLQADEAVRGNAVSMTVILLRMRTLFLMLKRRRMRKRLTRMLMKMRWTTWDLTSAQPGEARECSPPKGHLWVFCSNLLFLVSHHRIWKGKVTWSTLLLQTGPYLKSSNGLQGNVMKSVWEATDTNKKLWVTPATAAVCFVSDLTVENKT